MKPLIAIVGRPNVGKSTLFNRLLGRRLAIVEDVPGVTRDRHFGETDWNDRPFILVDTGGFVPGEADELLTAVREQAELAITESQVVLFVVDGRAGLTAADIEVANQLRKSGRPVVLVVNKADSDKMAGAMAAEFYKLGLGEPHPVSAEHGLGLTAMLDRAVELLPEPNPEEGSVESEPLEGEEGEEGLEEGEEADEEVEGGKRPKRKAPDGIIRLAIVGRPNVGKSTLINALLGSKRMVASEVPGTTRDPIDTALEFKGRKYLLTDTAGIRRRKAITQKLEQFTVVASLNVIDRSDVAVVLLDATEPAVDQDARLAGIAEEKGRGIVVVVNKWDKVPKEKRDEEAFREELKYRLKFVSYAPIIFTSALTGAKVQKVLEIAADLYDQFHFRAPTPHLNRLLEHVVDSHPAPIAQGKPLRLYYIAQVSSAPPTFAITANLPKAMPDAYRRYLVNQLRETFGLRVPIHLVFRERPGKAKRAARKNPDKARAPKRRRT